jgi:predicted alpha/beta-hydrolase family hydrolase
MSTPLDDLLPTLNQTEDYPLGFQIELPDVKKPVKAHLWRDRSSSLPQNNIHLCIYTHGAGGTCISPGSSRLCESMVESSNSQDGTTLVVLGFDGPMHLGSRIKSFVALIKWAAGSGKVTTISLSGRSMGCRAATIAAKEVLEIPKFSRKLVLQSYPLLGGGKGTKDAERKQVLLDLPADVSILFQSGNQDEMCPLEDLRELRSSMNAKSTLVSIQDADHGLQLASGVAARGSKSSLEEEIGRKAGQVARDWLLNSEDLSKLGDEVIEVKTDDDSSTVSWSDFSQVGSAEAHEQPKQDKRPASEEPTSAKPSPRQSKRTKRS